MVGSNSEKLSGCHGDVTAVSRNNMFASSQLPDDVIGTILRRAELSIDTRLVLKDYIAPARVKVPESLAEKLGAIHVRRTQNYREYVDQKRTPGVWCVGLDYSGIIRISDRKYMEIYVSDIEDGPIDKRYHVIEFHQKIVEMIDNTREQWVLYNATCDAIIGQPYHIEFFGGVEHV